jgi:Flp pilus assembly protein TadD
VLPSWGYSYGYTYSNPYYVAPASVATAAYDYSQPIVINTYNNPSAEATSDSSNEQTATQTVEETTEEQAGYKLFDQAVEAFKAGDYQQALRLDESAIQKVPDDPVLHEFGALCLFALEDYTRAAAVLNALLAVAPGMDWTTVSSLYPDVDIYTAQLRKLEAFSKQNPNDGAAHFVLAYQYMVAGHSDAAVRQLKQVVAVQPEDAVAQRILDALTQEEQQSEDAAEEIPPPPATEAASETEQGEEKYTDLVGRWVATRNEDRFGLTIDEDAKFTWAAIPKDQERITLTGQAATSGDTLVLENSEQGNMAGQVKSLGPDKFQFIIAGGPPGDEGLTFERVE